MNHDTLTLTGQSESDEENLLVDAVLFTITEVDGETVVTITGQPMLAEPTWGVLLLP